MSSILDALKKVESDAAARTGMPLHGGGPPPGRSRPAHPLIMATAGVVLFAAFGFGIWEVATRTAQQSPPATPAETPEAPWTEKEPPPRQPGIPSAERQEGGLPVESAASGSGSLPPEAPEPGRGAIGPGGSGGSAVPGPAAGTAPGTIEAEPAGVSPGVPSQTRGPQLPERASRAEPAPSTPAPQPGTQPQIMEDGILTLQAISWSASPENRITVINGKIGREGDRIEGYAIQRINEEDVWVSGKGTTRRLVFKLK